MKLCTNFFLSIVLFFSFQSTFAQEGRVLNVPYVFQVHTCCWCWAGATTMVINYYGNDVEVCEIVEYMRSYSPTSFGTENCCNIPTPDKCIKAIAPFNMEHILENWNISNHYGYGRYTMSEIQTEVDAGRPWIIQWFPPTGNGHTVVGRGYQNSNVYIADPFDGYHVYTYDWVVYRGTSTPQWTYTNEIYTTPPCTNVTYIYTNAINSDLTSTATYDIDCSSTIGNNSDVIFRAGHEIILQPGFTLNLGSTLELSTHVSYGCD